MTKITGIAGYSFTCKSCKKEIDIDCLNSLQGNGFNAHGLTHHCICLDCLDNYVDHCDIDNNDTTLIPREYACKCCSKTVEVEHIKNNEYCGNESISLQVCVNCFDSEVSVAEGGYLVINQYNPDGSLKSIWVDENGNPEYIQAKDGDLHRLADVIDYIRDLDFELISLEERVNLG